MNNKIFRNSEHLNAYNKVISQMKYSDVYHISVAYLLTLDDITRKHFSDVFDIEDDCIKHDALKEHWQTSTTLKVTRLAFNLWNGCTDDGDEYTDSEGYTEPLPSEMYSVDNIFCCSYARYFFEAVKLRFPEYVDGE